MKRPTGIKQDRLHLQKQLEDTCYRDLFADSKDAVYISSRKGKILNINRAGVELFGYPRDQLVGMDIRALYADPRDRARFREEIERAGAVKDYEVTLRRNDGTILSCLLTSTLIRSADGEVEGYQGIIRDITAQKKAEAALRQSREKFSMIFRSSPDWIAISDLVDGRLIEVNDAFLRITGYAREEVIGKPSGELGLWVDPGERQKVVKLLREKGQIIDHEARFRLKSGEVRTFLRSAELIELEGETCVINISRDITDRKRAEEEIRGLNRELRRRVAELTEANRELDAFGHTVSHDLRAPLVTIGGFAGRLRKYAGGLDEKGVGMFEAIQANVKRMETLINGLLAFSRTGRQKMTVSEVDMDELVKSVFDELRAAASGRAVFLKTGRLLPLCADRTLMRQVVVNLLSNAFKFTLAKKKAVIEVGSTRCGDEILYTFKDNGIGFGSEDAAKLFDVFHRGHGSDHFEGSGIGLSIVHRIITRHGGRVCAEGRPGKGAVFSFALPAPDRGNTAASGRKRECIGPEGRAE
jgi:PAS domain S-box-containing protein